MQVNDAVAADLVQGMKQAMRRLAASVVIVTARDGNNVRNAMAATSCTSLSMEPPSLILCVNRTASLYPILDHGKDFCVNVLAGSHEAVSVICSGAIKGEERFQTGAWENDPDTNVPFLADAQASLICSVDDIHHYGTHGIFIGKVKRVHLHGDVYPLIYLNGKYSSIVEGAKA